MTSAEVAWLQAVEDAIEEFGECGIMPGSLMVVWRAKARRLFGVPESAWREAAD